MPESPHRRSSGARRYYWERVREIPGVLWDALGAFGLIVATVVFVAFLVNREAGEALADWQGISPWWGLLVLGALFVFGLLKSNYQAFERSEEARERAEHERADAERERDELRARLEWVPAFDVTTGRSALMHDTQDAYDHQVTLHVANASKEGGEEHTARGVTPEVAILHNDGREKTSNFGWDASTMRRDLPPTGEPYPIHVAYKHAGSSFPVADLRGPTETAGGPLWGAPWNVRLTLRGDNWRGKLTYDFVLHNQANGMRLEGPITREPAP